MTGWADDLIKLADKWNTFMWRKPGLVQSNFGKINTNKKLKIDVKCHAKHLGPK